jgi:hypothetical protein
MIAKITQYLIILWMISYVIALPNNHTITNTTISPRINNNTLLSQDQVSIADPIPLNDRQIRKTFKKEIIELKQFLFNSNKTSFQILTLLTILLAYSETLKLTFIKSLYFKRFYKRYLMEILGVSLLYWDQIHEWSKSESNINTRSSSNTTFIDQLKENFKQSLITLKTTGSFLTSLLIIYKMIIHNIQFNNRRSRRNRNDHLNNHINNHNDLNVLINVPNNVVVDDQLMMNLAMIVVNHLNVNPNNPINGNPIIPVIPQNPIPNPQDCNSLQP